tara:strand:+ start:101 stop:373 length:273 start_codon:yes stop_codon:yes gene_type:complete
MGPLEITHQTFKIADGWCVGEVNVIAPNHQEVSWTGEAVSMPKRRHTVKVETFSQAQEVINWLVAIHGAIERGELGVNAPSFLNDSDWIE